MRHGRFNRYRVYRSLPIVDIFGDLDVRVGPWDVDYGPEAPLEGQDEPAAEEVAIDIEMKGADWRPIEPAPSPPPAQLVFVDGVRRLEARLVVRRGERIFHGAFGSYGVGAVAVSAGVARHAEAVVGRLAVVGAGESLPNPVSPMPGLTYQPLSTADAEADGPLRAIHNEMRGAEERLAHTLSDHEDTVVVADGPLTFEDPVRGAVVGYIKRLFKLYLPENRQHVLARLTTGTRTPLFGLRATRRFARYAWFIRLAPRQLADSELSGIVRLEVSDSIGVDAAKRLADATAFLLPKFAPPRSRDPRSPQNLLPIGALEAKLRRRLGDARLIRRHIETLIARGVQDAANTA